MNGNQRSVFVRNSLLFLIAVAVGCNAAAPPSTSPSKTSGPNTTAQGSSTTTEAAVAETPFELENGFTLLTLDQFDSFGTDAETWKASNDGIACTGKPRGYLYSRQPYQNFTLKLDYRFPRPDNLKDDAKFKGNTGFLVYLVGEHKLWPECIEVQGKYVQMAAIKENGGAPPVETEDNEDARQQARKPVGQWNSLQITSKSGELTVSIDGTLVSHSQPGSLIEGLIGIQSEDHPFEVRRMRIRAESTPERATP